MNPTIPAHMTLTKVATAKRIGSRINAGVEPCSFPPLEVKVTKQPAIMMTHDNTTPNHDLQGEW